MVVHGGAHGRADRRAAAQAATGRGAAGRDARGGDRRGSDRFERGLPPGFRLGSAGAERGSVGGWCRSVESNGFTFDYAGHIMCSSGDPYVYQLYRMLLGDNVHWQDREAWIYSKNVYTRYPFQGSLYGASAGSDQGMYRGRH